MFDVIKLAVKHPRIYLQLWWDMELAREKLEDQDRPKWKKRGETAADARDRMKKEREELKRLRESELAKDVHN